MATIKKEKPTAEKASSRRVRTLAVPIVLYRSAGSVFNAPTGSTFGILPSGALVIQHPSSGNSFTHAFAPGDWVSVNQK